MRRGWWMLMLAVWLPLLAQAHPLSKSKWSLRTAMQLKGDTLDAVIVLEVPFKQVSKDLTAKMEAAKASSGGRKAAQAVIDAYAATHWARMADTVSITVDGKAVEGAWKPRDNRYNGKGAVDGGFFMYIVEFVPEGALPLDEDVTIVVENTGYADEDMVYSAMVIAGDPWTVAHDSSKAVLPDRPYDLRAPDFWSPDAALRKVVARFTSGG